MEIGIGAVGRCERSLFAWSTLALRIFFAMERAGCQVGICWRRGDYSNFIGDF